MMSFSLSLANAAIFVFLLQVKPPIWSTVSSCQLSLNMLCPYVHAVLTVVHFFFERKNSGSFFFLRRAPTLETFQIRPFWALRPMACWELGVAFTCWGGGESTLARTLVACRCSWSWHPKIARHMRFHGDFVAC
jgi:hypothetical protein